MYRQQTLRNAVSASGVGLHSGKKVNLTIRPAEENTGIIFVRVDLASPVYIPASLDLASSTEYSTSLSKDGVSVSSIEHLMAVLSAFGIDNAYIEVDGSELPVMDGSAGAFVFLIQSAGFYEQSEYKRFYKVKKKITFDASEQGKGKASIAPCNQFRVNYTLFRDFEILENRPHSLSLDISLMTFVRELSRARGFVFQDDLDVLKSRNLAQGISSGNTVFLDDTKVLNEGGLRMKHEPLRHKVLDVVGDLYLLGYNILGEFTGYTSNHEMNYALMSKFIEDSDAWEIVSCADDVAMVLPT